MQEQMIDKNNNHDILMRSNEQAMLANLPYDLIANMYEVMRHQDMHTQLQTPTHVGRNYFLQNLKLNIHRQMYFLLEIKLWEIK